MRREGVLSNVGVVSCVVYGGTQVQRMEVLDASGKLSENDVKRLANLRVTHRVLLKKKKVQEEAVR